MNGRSRARLVAKVCPGERLARALDRRAHDFGDVDEFALRPQGAGLDARHVQEIGDESRQATGFFLDRGEQVGALLGGHRVAELA